MMMMMKNVSEKFSDPGKYKLLTKVKLRNLTFDSNYVEVVNERKNRTLMENCVLEYRYFAQQHVPQANT
jgi:hypothetical protein